MVEFGVFRSELALPRADRSRDGCPPGDAVLMFRALVLQALDTLSNGQAEYQLRDRLSFMRFAGLALHDAGPDARTIRPCRERLTRAGALARLFASFDAVLAERGFPARGRQIVDATVVGLAAKRTNRRRRLSREQKAVPRGTPHPRAGRRRARARPIAIAAGPSRAPQGETA
ncbi:hypothetical protein GCM10010964_00140 [Caldovatus sediminis]|uniref:Transposase InsH N-terminal domain-containing protein n=1 Tax=Caldovatus sediminis TaxID=2041189 RepID=A0A8J2Z769_9PROT|nr:hypothetical protein GCM10010964_00140 [Caldovatus sediminis]